MKAKLLIVGGIITVGVIFAACKKDSYNTKPTLTFKSISAETLLQFGAPLNIKLELTDKEGDISKDTLYIEFISKNCSSPDRFITKNIIGEFPTNSNIKAELDLNFVYGTSQPGISGLVNSCQQPPNNTDPRINDTCHMRFWFSDNANNVSDTLDSPQYILVGR